MYHPPWLVPGMFVWFVLDNIDFFESTPCGMNTLHETATAVSDEITTKLLRIDRSFKSQSLEATILCDIVMQYHVKSQ